MAEKWVYLFSEGNADMRELLGGKGANLAEMTRLGLNLPQGFIITTEACTQYYNDGRKINDEIQGQIMDYISRLEQITGKKFGCKGSGLVIKENPLLLSVRSGAGQAMPGMMDTVLNLGLNEDVVEIMAAKSGNSRWAWDCYRRFIQMYSVSVMEFGRGHFEKIIDKMKAEKEIINDSYFTADDLKELVYLFKAEYKAQTNEDFPSDPKVQLIEAVKAVFRSWDNPRANMYRRDMSIPFSWGTAATIQSMVFGNMGDDCGTGIAFTRDPATGKKGLAGEFLLNGQGEDVVSGVRIPVNLSKMSVLLPAAYAQLEMSANILEYYYKDMQDMEFTVEHGKFYMLQTRNGKRTPKAAVKIAADLVREGLRTEMQAADMVSRSQIEKVLKPYLDVQALKAAVPIAKGLGAAPGSVCGQIVFTAEDAQAWKAAGKKVLLVKSYTSPEDLEGIKSADGVVTSHGGMTSSAAVICRCIDKCCITGCYDISVDETEKICKIGNKIFSEGDFISIDGNTGCIYDGIIPTIKSEPKGNVALVLSWIEKYKEN